MSILYSYIYKVTNIINNKTYIGKTTRSFEQRKREHLNSSLNPKTAFHYAIKKYTSENFKWEILFEDFCHINKINSIEIFFISYYESFGKNGYNLTIGGDGGDTLSNHPNHKKIQEKLKISRNKVNPETGLSPNQQIGITSTKTKMKINPETGLNIFQETGKKVSLAMKTIDSETGLSPADKISIKLKENYNNGFKNHNSTRYLLIAPNGQKIGAYGNLLKICNKYNLSYTRILKFLNKGLIPKTLRKSMIPSINCTNWQICEINNDHTYKSQESTSFEYKNYTEERQNIVINKEIYTLKHMDTNEIISGNTQELLKLTRLTHQEFYNLKSHLRHSKRWGILKDDKFSCDRKIKIVNKSANKTCEYCGIVVSPANYKRWHGDNCKHKF